MINKKSKFLTEYGANPNFYEIIDQPTISKNGKTYHCGTQVINLNDFIKNDINNTKNLLKYYIYDINDNLHNNFPNVNFNKNDTKFIRFFTVNDNGMKIRIEKIKKIKRLLND